jgi:hypothetical protein
LGVDSPRRQQDLAAEDPRAGVDDDLARADVVARVIHLADVTISGVNLVPDDVCALRGDGRSDAEPITEG